MVSKLVAQKFHKSNETFGGAKVPPFFIQVTTGSYGCNWLNSWHQEGRHDELREQHEKVEENSKNDLSKIKRGQEKWRKNW